MKFAIVLFILTSIPTFAAPVECKTNTHTILIEKSGVDLKVVLNGESALADGLLNSEEVDIVARFRSAGEMTLFAKIGKASPDNYLFLSGKRFSVTCR